MNFYGPRQRQDNGLWHYTVANRRSGTHPIGNCANGCPGHATREQACQHYKEGQIEAATIDPQQHNKRTGIPECQVCGEDATHLARIPGGYNFFDLCEAHASKDFLHSLYEPGESFGT